jgi:Cu/Ag efflux pump CusA
MTPLVGWSLRSRTIVLGLAAALLLVGVVQLQGARIDVLPESSPTYVEVQTEALGLSAAEVEQFVTVPMEALMLSGVAWVESIDSRSVPGLSSIVLTFEPGTDLMRARQMVQERLTQAHALPNVSRPPQMIQPLSSSSRLMVIGLSSTTLSPIELSVLARWTVRPRLMGVPGVANVSIWGQRERQLQVQVEPARLEAAGITLDQIVRTTGNALWVSPLSYLNASTPGAGGFIDTPNQRLGIRHILPIRSPDDLSQVAIEGAPTMRLGDVVTVVEDHQPLIGDAATDDGRGLLLVVEKLPGESVGDVTRDIEDALAAMAAGLAGVAIDTEVYRPATFVDAAIANLGLVLLIALLVVALVIILFLRQLRAVAITLISVAVSFVAAALLLHATGSSINVLVIAGLVVALGVVIDDIVVDVDDVMKRMRDRAGEAGATPAMEALPIGDTLAATYGRLRGPMTYATAIVLLLLIPVFVVDGATGAFIRPFAISFALAIVASMVVCLTVTPALAALLLREPTHLQQARRDPLGIRYRQLLAGAIRRPWVAVGVAGVLLVAGIGLAGQVPRDLTPQFQERDLLVDVAAAPGTSRTAMERIAGRATAELRAVPGVESVASHLGRAVMSDQVVNVNAAQLWVRIAPDADYDATLAVVRGVVGGYPGLSLNVNSYLNGRAETAFTSPSEPVQVRVFGPDLGQLLALGESVKASMDTVPGVVDSRVSQAPFEPTIQVEVDLDAAFTHGVRPGDVRRAASTLVNGLEVGNLFEEQKVFEVMVVGVPDLRHSVESVAAMAIDTPSGAQVPLSDIADVRLVPAPTRIDRSGISRYIDIVAGVEGRDVAAVKADVTAVLRAFEFPLEYHAELGTQETDRLAAMSRIGIAGIAAALGVLLVLQAALGSWRLAGASMLVLAFAVSGGLLTGFLTGQGLTLGALLGCFAVAAIAVRNLLALLARLQALDDESLDEGNVVHAVGERLSPILMTLLATVLALVPILVLGGRAGLELFVPMAVVIVGGLVTSALLMLFVVPAMYIRIRATPPLVAISIEMPALGSGIPVGETLPVRRSRKRRSQPTGAR